MGGCEKAKAFRIPNHDSRGLRADFDDVTVRHCKALLSRANNDASRQKFREVSGLGHFPVRWLHPSRRRGVYHRAALRADPLAPPQSLTQKEINILGVWQ